jgi:ATP-dependent RNA helicase RhlE
VIDRWLISVRVNFSEIAVRTDFGPKRRHDKNIFMIKFSELRLHDELLKNLERLEHQRPTPIQERAIPVILKGLDVLGIAQTGTGKTGAFSLPILHELLSSSENKNHLRALILVPTRELCSQIQTAIQTYAENTPIKAAAVYGGVNQSEQVRALRDGVDILVATPGRLLDLLEQRLLRLTGIETFVIDEADRMLDMGFIDDIKTIIGKLPEKKQTLLFSATMPPEIEELASGVLKHPHKIEVAAQSTVAANIDQKVFFCQRDHKFQLLKKILKEEKSGLVLVFTRTKNIADNVVAYLAQNRIASRAIHGDKDQSHREMSLRQFDEGSIRVLIATDLVSRGIDVDDLALVVNFDLPLDPESYVHRIGRTARAGKSGRAISFCEEEQKKILSEIEELIGKKIKSEKFEGKNEAVRVQTAAPKKVTAPTPGRSQEKPAWHDHSKRQKTDEAGKKINRNPAFKKKKKRK